MFAERLPGGRKGRVKQGIFGRWYVFHPLFDGAAWSGLRWVECTPEGFPIGQAQVCNFETEDEAVAYCFNNGFDTVSVAA